MIENLFRKSKKIDYKDIVHSKKLYRVNSVHGKGERWAEPIEKIIEEQAIYPLQYGKDMGLQRICYLASTGKADKAVKEIKRITKPIYRSQLETSDVCGLLTEDTKDLFLRNYEGPTKLQRAPSGECYCAFEYIDTCLIGARIAELNKEYKNAKILYGRAKKVNDRKKSRTIYFEKECEERDIAWRKAMKRMYKAGAFGR